MTMNSLTIRPLDAGDSVEALTALLHKAYASLGAQGWNFTAVDQSVAMTHQRIAQGCCLLAHRGDALLGTVLIRGPYRPERDAWSGSLSTPWYTRLDTAILSQFAVDPDDQGRGVGAQLMAAAEALALSQGFTYVTLDTAKPAVQLRQRYERSGYRQVAEVHWDGKTYDSVLMVKPLAQSPLKAGPLLMARYNLWATRRLLAAVAELSDNAYRLDTGLFFKSVHGTLNHLLVGEHLLWFRRFAEGVSPMLALDQEVEPDRAVLAERLLDGAQRWAPLIAGWDDGRFGGRLDYTTTRGSPASLPFAATLSHVFNHSTHHRGQITAALTAMGQPCPELDMVYMLQEESSPA